MEAVKQPLQVVRELYAARGAPADGQDFGEKDHFAQILADPTIAAQVPIFTEDTADLLPNQCLVRFRGMVADMLNPEYYVGEFQRADGTWATAKYADQLDEPLPEQGGSDTRIAERRPLLLVPVPAESAWAAAVRADAARASLTGILGTGAAAAADGGAGKRQREPGAGEADGLAAAGEDVSMSMMVSDATGQTTADDCDSAAARARRGTGSAHPAGQEASSAGAVSPGADLPGGCCMTYVYDDAEVKLNDVVDVVGVLSRVPELAAAHMRQQEGGQPSSMLLDDLLAAHLPTSKAPRLHALLLSSEGGAAAGTPPAAAEAPQARPRVLGFLSQVLGGDDLAAEYLLLQLLGRVHRRTAESAVGTLALNLVVEPNGAAAAAQQELSREPARQERALSPLGAALGVALGALAPRCAALPLSVAALNAAPWWPRRDQGSQRLVSGPLQLAANTQVVLDETAMAAGTLNEVGLRNLGALHTLMTRQRVGYDFEFFSLDQPADAPVTVLSLGRSLLKEGVAVTLPLRPTAPLADAAAVHVAAASADLAPLRAYLAAARAADFFIPPDMEAFLQQELAGARQKDRDVTERTFHTWMNLARLLALSHGEAGLTRERWLAVRAMEAARGARLAAPQAVRA